MESSMDWNYDDFWDGTGWEGIWRDFVKQLKEMANGTVQILDSKEKFGTLRVYLSCHTDEKIDELVRELEKKSKEVCIECGKPAKFVTNDNWIAYLCEECTEKMMRRNGIPMKKL